MEKRDIGHNSLEADSSLQKQITSEELESQAVDTADSESVMPANTRILFVHANIALQVACRANTQEE